MRIPSKGDIGLSATLWVGGKVLVEETEMKRDEKLCLWMDMKERK